YTRSAGHWGGDVASSFEDRFKSAFDCEVQSWVDAARRGQVGGPTAWDGYATAACCDAGVAAQKSGEKVALSLTSVGIRALRQIGWSREMVEWMIEAVSFGNCNCDYACPCQFESRPTRGHCRGFEAGRIERGHFGDVPLDGLCFAVLYAWP